MKPIMRALLAFLIIIPAVLFTAFLGFGGRVATIETPSMGTYAPVGTIIVGLPVAANDLHVGNVILFQPPGETRTYFHRIERIEGKNIITHGDLNAAVDPWTITAADVHARDVLRVPYLGWFVKYLPFLLLGGIALGVYIRLFVKLYQLPVIVLGVSALMAVGNMLVRPFVRADMLSQTVEHGKLVVHFVVTGVLPLMAHASNGNTVIANPGQAVSITVGTAQTATGGLTLTPLFLNPTLVILGIIMMGVPLLLSLFGRISWLRGVAATTAQETPAEEKLVVHAPMQETAPANIFGGRRGMDIDATYRTRTGVPGSYKHEIDSIYKQRASAVAVSQ